MVHFVLLSFKFPYNVFCLSLLLAYAMFVSFVHFTSDSFLLSCNKKHDIYSC